MADIECIPAAPKAGAGVAAPKADCVVGVAPNAEGAAAVPPNEKFPNAAAKCYT